MLDFYVEIWYNVIKYLRKEKIKWEVLKKQKKNRTILTKV